VQRYNEKEVGRVFFFVGTFCIFFIELYFLIFFFFFFGGGGAFVSFILFVLPPVTANKNVGKQMVARES